jgi:hypothetical protein
VGEPVEISSDELRKQIRGRLVYRPEALADVRATPPPSKTGALFPLTSSDRVDATRVRGRSAYPRI